MKVVRSVTLGCVSVAVCTADATPTAQWLDRNFFKRVSITGRRVLGFHLYDVQGDTEAFNSLTYYGQGSRRFTDTGQMTIVGDRVLGVLDFRMQLSDNRFNDPQGQKLSLNYNRGPLTVNLGDIQGSLLNTNRFAGFSKTLKGAQAGFRQGRFAAKAVHSEAKGSAKTVSIQGDGSAGPYFLNSSQLVTDSEEIQVDGQPMKLGKDYTINYELGSITFVNRTIAQTSTIVASYEAFGYNSGRGTVQGGGLSYDAGRFGRIGLTVLEQKAGGAQPLGARTDLFQGFGAPSTPYFLQFEPMAGRPIIVKADGILQTEGVDYVFDTGNPSIFYFRRFMPASSNIDVIYTPKPTQTVDGDRRVTGFDYRLPLGNRGSLGYSQATGRLDNAISPLSGTARGLQLDYNFGSMKFKGEVRDIPQGFVSVETRGLSRNERALDLSLEGKASGLNYGASHLNSSVAFRNLTGSNEVAFTSGRTTTSRAFVSRRSQTGAGWTLEQKRVTTDSVGKASRLDTSSLGTQYGFGKLSTTLDLEHLNGVAPVSTTSGSVISKVTSDTVRLGADYAAGGGLSIGGRASVSDIRTTGKSGRGEDVSLSLGYRPSKPYSLDLSYAYSKSGKLAVLSGFNNGYGYGYGGNGFSGAATGTGVSGFGGNVRALQARSSVQLGKRLNLDARFLQAATEGSVSSNSRTTAAGLGLQWDLGRSHSMSLDLNQSRTSFLSTAQESSTRTLDLFLAGAPGSWSYRLGSSYLLSSGGAFAQNSFQFDGYLRRRLDPRQAVGFHFRSGATTGYLPQREAYFGLFYEHQLYRNIALVSSYKWRNVRNLDQALLNGAYRATGFDLELTFDFAP